MASITVEAWADGVLKATATFQADAKDGALESFGDAFDGVDRVVISSDRPILVDDIDVTTYWYGELPDPPPVPDFEPIVVNFEGSEPANSADEAPAATSTLSFAGFEFLDTSVTSRSKGVVSGTQAAETIGDSMTILRSDGGTFDFESGWFTAVDGRKVDAVVEAWQDGAMIGSQEFTISDRRELLVDLDDALFNSVDQVVISANGGLIVDDLGFLV
jgi:hypothetical protein